MGRDAEMIRHKLPKYVHAYVDRHGTPRIYLRHPGRPRMALPGPLFSEPFWTAYHKALAAEAPPKAAIGAARSKPGSFNMLIAEYYASSAFTTKANATKESYRRDIERFRREYGDMPVATMQAKHVDILLGKIAAHSTAQAKNMRKRLYTLMRLARKWRYRPDNPVVDSERIGHIAKGYPAWSEDDIAMFRAHWPLGSKQRIAMEILLHTGLRRADAVRIGPQHVKSAWFAIATSKSRGATTVNFPVHPDLVPHLEQAPKDALAFLVTEQGKSRSEKAFTNWIIEAAHEAGLPPHRSPHGLRKSACIRLAEVGCTTQQIMTLTGHRNAAELEPYLRNVNQRKLAQAAMDALLGGQNATETKVANPTSALAKAVG